MAPSQSSAPPSLITRPEGCLFAPRCPLESDRCHTVPPLIGQVAGDQDRRVKSVIVGAQAVPGILPLLREGATTASICTPPRARRTMHGSLGEVSVFPDVAPLCHNSFRLRLQNQVCRSSTVRAKDSSFIHASIRCGSGCVNSVVPFSVAR